MIKAKKSLGQNFLIDTNILKKIVSVTNIENKYILEVGPGTGNLTSHILKKSPKFIISWKRWIFIQVFKKKFEDKIIIINKDILEIDEKKLYKEKLIVFWNLPFNISTEILAKWILNLDDKVSGLNI